MKFVWDEEKNSANRKKHRVSFVALLLVAHTYTDADGQETVRIISARKADKAERRIYAEGH